MISGGNRNPLYDEPAAVTIVDPAPPHLPGKPDSALVRAWRSAGLFGEDPIDSRAANAECRSDGAGRFTLSVHPLRESGFRLIEHLNSADLLSARPTWRACRRGRSP